jgi:hypothetical protein
MHASYQVSLLNPEPLERGLGLDGKGRQMRRNDYETADTSSRSPDVVECVQVFDDGYESRLFLKNAGQ